MNDELQSEFCRLGFSTVNLFVSFVLRDRNRHT